MQSKSPQMGKTALNSSYAQHPALKNVHTANQKAQKGFPFNNNTSLLTGGLTNMGSFPLETSFYGDNVSFCRRLAQTHFPESSHILQGPTSSGRYHMLLHKVGGQLSYRTDLHNRCHPAPV